jgi:LAO/AO transport system kinase
LIKELIKGILSSNKRSIARGISLVENEAPESSGLLKSLYPYTGKSYLIGVTGPPGAGKSTITNNLAKLMRERGYKIGIIAVDPTSPFTGGALLGDRIRMQEIGIDDEVFIRSMATRGSLGGLAKMAKEACEVLDASGKDFIIIETVGVGQSELDIAQTADTTIVVLVPESGDAVQTMKAGLMEIGDIFVINKTDREGADALAVALRTMLHLKMKESDDWETKVVKTIGLQNKGIGELFGEIECHKAYLETNGKMNAKRKENLIKQINELVNNKLEVKFWSDDRKKTLDKNIADILSRKTNPYDFVEELFKSFNK